MNISEGAAHSQEGCEDPTGWILHRSAISCSQSPQFLRKSQAGPCGGSSATVGDSQWPRVFLVCSQQWEFHGNTSLLLSALSLPGPQLKVAAQKSLSCQKACYIQLDVWNGNLFRIKHQ